MKADELKQKTGEELSKLLNELRAKLLKFRFELADKKLKDFSVVNKTKKDIARILTAFKQLKS
ncbi:MAG: 50S ribosomal protein L29 [Candidatus Yanofskybacteria bacterium RIFCSPHIGHO2_02_FULL_44_12b]|uniref:Large ribosomal subunit protein uL29 n=2 Tax=Candidatus Yanofskyibacteriota TaxID=1752733 RepID=A0A1F8GL51_9BACT|nr:MAG: 50S ribosomal protein L29 [Candidatus Yanofskybacteria bacterium GW2011_GWA2_44_9]OGN04822.1 MAG: 50S ribosomal protein L29 [Candidatus Yanofskybacteria bacterium RIFCSPHIGHO2_01_FULL_44_24]OGN16068.1 MAG: 50S ribosomal protein L29 [Candidatus Yanofskybacteria bacterium RIFCSPHIGHO2_02_FULL_44_12b]OGN25139.1 MAG: 50S ribosomal protein L29 [Candidatus Yanofskybacteria bacterium RIFCSPLOWO2_01_FULL_44_22]